MNTTKQVFYLMLEETLPEVQTEFPIINWVYRWDGKFAYSQAFRELIGYNLEYN